MIEYPRKLPIGAELITGAKSGVHIRVWAPTHQSVQLVLESPVRMNIALQPEVHGYFSVFVPGARPGMRYRFQLDDDPQLHADPASRFQPEGPFGPSEVIDANAFAWSDDNWQGLPLERHVLYELHIGTFTPEGTWVAAAEYLPYLVEVGITTLEVMPIHEFAGRYNWGYDGVNLFAPTHNYGSPDEMRQFIDRAHQLELAVILDVVYNHFGPSGNSMFAWSPYFRRNTANEWGDEINFDGEGSEGVREFFISNAAYWIDEFHLDGLRIDATQAIKDRSKPHVLTEIVRAARSVTDQRQLLIIGENEPEDATLYSYGFDSLWNDDFHHTSRVAITGVIDGYLHDYRGTPQELVSAMVRGFLYQGQLYRWQSNPRGTPTYGIKHHRFINYLENHDQVANLGFGERLISLTDPATWRAMTAVLLLGPELPMLFQGQECGTRKPWLFFVDHCEDLHQPIREGRATFVSQFARLATPEVQKALPDPCLEATFQRCILDPLERQITAPTVQLHRDLLTLRRIDPAFTASQLDAVCGAVLSEHAFCIRYRRPDPRQDRLLLVNLGPTFRQAVVPEPLVAPPSDHGWRLLWSSEDPRYGGHGTPHPFTRARLAIPAHAAIVVGPDPDYSLRIEPQPPSGQVEL